MSYAVHPTARGGRRNWHDLHGLGSLDAGTTFAVGQQLVAGYNVQSSADAATKLTALRGAMAYGFRGAIVNAGWGGPGAPGGVPAGQLWIVVRIGAPGVTGAVMNQVFSNVGQQLQNQLPAGSRVTNTYASLHGGTATGTPSTSTPAPTTGGGGDLLSSIFGPTTTPATTPDGTLPADLTTVPQPFYLSEVGGIPVWALGIGGIALLGGVAFVALRKPHAAPKANRRRRVRRNGWRRHSASTLKGRRRSRRKRTSLRMNRRRSRRSRRSVRANRRRSRRSRRMSANTKKRRFKVPVLDPQTGLLTATELQRREKRALRKKRASVSRNNGYEYGVHGNNTGRINDPFSRMTNEDAAALDKIYRTEITAVRVANRLQRKYGHMITFRVKARPKNSGGFGQTIRYTHLDVAHPHRMRRSRARMRKNRAASVTYRGTRYTRRAPRPGDVFYMAKPVGTVPLLSSLMKLHDGGVIEDVTTRTRYDARIANVKTAWVRAHAR